MSYAGELRRGNKATLISVWSLIAHEEQGCGGNVGQTRFRHTGIKPIFASKLRIVNDSGNLIERVAGLGLGPIVLNFHAPLFIELVHLISVAVISGNNDHAAKRLDCV